MGRGGGVRERARRAVRACLSLWVRENKTKQQQPRHPPAVRVARADGGGEVCRGLGVSVRGSRTLTHPDTFCDWMPTTSAATIFDARWSSSPVSALHMERAQGGEVVIVSLSHADWGPPSQADWGLGPICGATPTESWARSVGEPRHTRWFTHVHSRFTQLKFEIAPVPGHTRKVHS